MWETAGPFRTDAQLRTGLAELAALQQTVDDSALARHKRFALTLQEKLDLRQMALASRAILSSARLRRETRGAHVRLDEPHTDPQPRVVRCDLPPGATDWHVTLA
jgi:succinate dehydrogenase/fumarate reductase flavoprotein subunit